ncbi:hypothetical protein QFZ40_003886 [Arthrobacter pascens]|uniref:DUF6176 family protein n=1 Tax=Arthrobacter pascens TaxID=1677 RepID=UPI00278AB74A|nr:DUF6176 family protein [Arthrobacter pascens]MDQ0635977.1 hypothetical protein [Arthrobacter pascens]
MECIVWSAPILPGKLDAWRVFAESAKGEDYDRSRKRMGVVREVVSLMQTPQGDFACIFQEAKDIAKAYQVVAQSDDPYDIWFRDQIMEFHGLTPEMLQGPPPAVVAVDYHNDEGSTVA